jgi:hypothetical protein
MIISSEPRHFLFFLLPKNTSSTARFLQGICEIKAAICFLVDFYLDIHAMAEILAVVASGAGLASLALQLADGIERLRKRCEDLRKLRENIGNLIEDLELVALQLKALEADHFEVLEFPMGPTILGRCQAHSEDVIKKLKDLIAVIPMTASRVSKIRILRALLKSKRWKIEFNELRSAVQDLKVDLIR